MCWSELDLNVVVIHELAYDLLTNWEISLFVLL